MTTQTQEPAAQRREFNADKAIALKCVKLEEKDFINYGPEKRRELVVKIINCTAFTAQRVDDETIMERLYAFGAVLDRICLVAYPDSNRAYHPGSERFSCLDSKLREAGE